MSLERLAAIEVEDEDGNVSVLRVRRLITQDTRSQDTVFSNELTFRPGGMAVATRLDLRTITTIDDGMAEAQEREGRELAALRERSGAVARTGGEASILPDSARVPGRRGPRKRKDQEVGDTTVSGTDVGPDPAA